MIALNLNQPICSEIEALAVHLAALAACGPGIVTHYDGITLDVSPGDTAADILNAYEAARAERDKRNARLEFRNRVIFRLGVAIIWLSGFGAGFAAGAWLAS